jgi:hypothetical protein
VETEATLVYEDIGITKAVEQYASFVRSPAFGDKKTKTKTKQKRKKKARQTSSPLLHIFSPFLLWPHVDLQDYVATVQSVTEEEAQGYGVILLPVMAQALVPVYNLPELAAANNTLVCPPPPFLTHSIYLSPMVSLALATDLCEWWLGRTSRCWMG